MYLKLMNSFSKLVQILIKFSFQSEITNISDDEWLEKKASWKAYVIEYMKGIRQEKPMAQKNDAVNGKMTLN